MVSRTMSLLTMFILMLIFLTALPVSAHRCIRRKFITFNTGLTPHIENYESRRNLIPTAIKNRNGEVLCLQEVWFERDIQNIRNSLASEFPHSYTPLDDIPGETSAPSCPTRNLATVAFLACAAGCVISRDRQTCVLTRCRAIAFRMPQTCITCTVMAFRDIATLKDLCFRPNNRINLQGLMILSKKPIKWANTIRYLNLPVKMLLQRGYIQARIRRIGARFVCTHLTANVGPYVEDPIAAATGFTSWEEQQAHEISVLRSNLAPARRQILLGDFNTGPGTDTVDAALPNNYDQLVSGYKNVYARKAGAQCTYCSANPLTDTTTNTMIDHILVKNLKTGFAKRSMKILNGETLSDHYGIKSNICVPKFCSKC